MKATTERQQKSMSTSEPDTYLICDKETFMVARAFKAVIKHANQLSPALGEYTRVRGVLRLASLKHGQRSKAVYEVSTWFLSYRHEEEELCCLLS
jgi:hypothetical protein